MTPAELVTLSLQQVARAHLDRLELDISPRLAALGTLSLPCTTLGMVLQNLIQNAAESAAAADSHACGCTCKAKVAPWRNRAALRFKTTKPAESRRDPRSSSARGTRPNPRPQIPGLGLHWCANTLNALGGGISAP